MKNFKLTLTDADTGKYIDAFSFHTEGMVRLDVNIIPPMDAMRLLVDLSDAMSEYMNKGKENGK
jgi:hypothetical protein